MRIRRNIFKEHLFVFVLVAFVALIAFLNYQPGTWLTGWDNLHPEFNFSLNIKRSIFAVWQEYQGLGLLGGMGHASDLPRQIFLWFCSFVLPASFLRYFWTFLMLLIGPLGVYFLIRFLIGQSSLANSSTSEESRLRLGTIRGVPLARLEVKLVAFMGAVFYLCNLATVQIFYTPYEAFTTHYGFLPWLVLVFLRFLERPSKRNLLWFILVNILAIPQGYVPTVFVVYLLTLGLVFLGRFWELGKLGLLESLGRFGQTLAIILAINAFWLLPFLYFNLTSLQSPTRAHLNFMVTEDMYLKSKKFGSLPNVALLKNFWFDYVEVRQGRPTYLIGGWRQHLENPYIQGIGFLFFAIVLFGLFWSWHQKSKYRLSFSLLFLFSFALLANNTWSFSLVDSLWRQIPLLDQVFRNPFTKFGNLALLSYSLFFAVGVLGVLGRLGRLGKKVVLDLVVVALVIFVWPIFQGRFFEEKLRLKIPEEYFQLFDFFRKEDENTRIANLPQPSYLAWSFYSWGHYGSGFLWYGIPQPILDRAFDVWNVKNEDYYWQVSYAIYSQNLLLLENVLEKYQINWLVIDENIIGATSQKTLLYTDKLEKLLETSQKVKLTKIFGQEQKKIKVYQVDLENKPNNFVFLASDLPQAGPEYKWNNEDAAFEELGNYYSLQFGGSAASFGAGIGHNSNQNGSQKKDDSRKQISNFKSDFHSSPNLLVNHQLRNQEIRVNTTPELNTTKFTLSNLETIGVIIRPPKNTWPALSEILANLKSSFSEKTGSLGRIIPAAFIYAQDNIKETPPPTANLQPITYFYYPFRSLFTGRQQEELEFEVEDKKDYFSFTTQLPKELAGQKLSISLEDQNELVFWDENLASSSAVPEIWLDGQQINYFPPFTGGESLQATPSVSLALFDFKEGNLEVRVAKKKGYYSYDSEEDEKLFIKKTESCDPFNQGQMKREIIRENTKRLLRFTSIGSSNCLGIDLPQLSHKIGYLVKIGSRNIKGKSLLFYVLNKNSKKSVIETYLPKNSNVKCQMSKPNLKCQNFIDVSYFIIPPMEKYGQGYSLHFDNISIGRQETINDLGRIEVYTIPYHFLKSLKIQSFPSELKFTSEPERLNFEIWHPNTSFYKVTLGTDFTSEESSAFGGATSEVVRLPTTLVLSQTFHPGWIGFYFKGLKPVFLRNHLLVNNWENGWRLNLKSQISNVKTTTQNFKSEDLKNQSAINNQQLTIYLFFWPQILQYLGFGLLVGVGVWLVVKEKKINS